MVGSSIEKIQSQIDTLEQALKRLKEAAQLEPLEIHKDGTIQRFEFCFELSWKLMQSFVQFSGMECQSPRNCIRISAQLDFIENPEDWIKYLESRNLTVHLYDQETADMVYNKAKEFISDAQSLLETVKEQLD